MPTQILELRFEADTPEHAVTDVLETLTFDGLEVTHVRTEP